VEFKGSNNLSSIQKGVNNFVNLNTARESRWKLLGNTIRNEKLKQKALKKFIKAVRSKSRNTYEAIHDLNEALRQKKKP